MEKARLADSGEFEDFPFELRLVLEEKAFATEGGDVVG
jgi:hypothetical protein